MSTTTRGIFIQLFMSTMLVFGICLGVVEEAAAVSVTVDEIICDQVSTPGCTGLSGTIEATQTAMSQLTFVVTNTSTSLISGAAVILSGWAGAFGSLDILSGSAALNGSTPVNGANSANLNNQWGFTNNIVSGPFGSLVTGGTVDTAIATLTASIHGGSTFAGNASPPANVQGPGDGILASGGNPGGQKAYTPSLTFTLNFNANVSSFLSNINNSYWVLSFGSPAAAVPIPGSALFFAVGFAALLVWRGGWGTEQKLNSRVLR